MPNIVMPCDFWKKKQVLTEYRVQIFFCVQKLQFIFLFIWSVLSPLSCPSLNFHLTGLGHPILPLLQFSMDSCCCQAPFQVNSPAERNLSFKKKPQKCEWSVSSFQLCCRHQNKPGRRPYPDQELLHKLVPAWDFAGGLVLVLGVKLGLGINLICFWVGVFILSLKAFLRF